LDFEEAFMGLRFQVALSSLVLVAIISRATAQEGLRSSANASSAETPRPVLTGKERLGPKWTDEQRIDNCRVPIDKRGSKPRPSSCADGPSS
jgi:hypothetical protein